MNIDRKDTFNTKPKHANALQVRPVIVHVTTVPASLFGFLSGQLAFMRESGFDVHVVSSPGELLDKFGRQEGVDVHGIEMLRRITPLADLKALYRMCTLFRSLKPAIVHAHSPKGGLLGMLAAWICRVPVRIYHVRGFPFMTAKGSKKVVLTLSERTSCRLARKVFCVSRSMKSVAEKKGICCASKSKVLLNGSGNGIDADSKFNPDNIDSAARDSMRARLEIPTGSRVIGFVGRIVKDKGICELAEAWRPIRDEFENVRLLLVGPFENEDPIPEDTRRELEADECVRVTGFVHSENLPEMFSIMDVFVLPSHREGFPVVLLEAGAMNLPVVASSIPGCTDAVVDGVTGTLYTCGEVKELADALRNYIKNEQLRRDHGGNARKRVLADYRREDIWNAILKEYKELMAESR